MQAVHQPRPRRAASIRLARRLSGSTPPEVATPTTATSGRPRVHQLRERGVGRDAARAAVEQLAGVLAPAWSTRPRARGSGWGRAPGRGRSWRTWSRTSRRSGWRRSAGPALMATRSSRPAGGIMARPWRPHARSRRPAAGRRVWRPRAHARDHERARGRRQRRAARRGAGRGGGARHDRGHRGRGPLCARPARACSTSTARSWRRTRGPAQPRPREPARAPDAAGPVRRG